MTWTFPTSIKAITFNGRKGKPALAKDFIRALSTPGILIEKAGFVFKFTADGKTLHLAAAPALINGQRMNHYDLTLPVENDTTLVGDINPEGIFTILFKAPTLDLSSEQKTVYREAYALLASWLLAGGYAGTGELHPITTQILLEAGLFDSSTVPKTLTDLAKASCSQG